MEPVPCPFCSKPVSPEAAACPQCGHPVKKFAGFEWRTRAQINGWPLVHVAAGRNKKTGKPLVAKGIVAVGQFAVGFVTVAQFGIGILFGFGQFIAGFSALAQFALALRFGMGQFATGMTAIGQFAAGEFVLAQIGLGRFLWTAARQDPEAAEHFQRLWETLRGIFGI